MTSITIRNLEPGLKASLRLRAARHGVSMEQEVRNILQNALAADSAALNGSEFAQRIRQRFQGLEADQLTLPERPPARALPDLAQP
ncbi:pantothenate metabolism flavoprotein [Acidovorax sp. HDW3]|uniref:FitA-like ribbon-helix-helix domain-containing protein n=1 Tax=Acidovorax sp. HDW3 TaxID=2714923 RepID=UPI001409085C|nr:pantothenate metabolism flavoprotein [Acidovorax sp. HDW3]QIL42846.1 pantothenate metabolism flavoprotein [Acidovorax sp. HDW3]